MATQADKAKFVELLAALNSADNATRQKAETLYQQAKQADPDSLVIGMLAILGSPDVEETLRRHDAVLLRQLTAKGPPKDFVFARLTAQHQQEVAAELLRRFELEAAPKLQKKIGEVISKLAEYVCDKDDPRGSLAPGSSGWPALLPQLFRMASASAGGSAEACESAMRLLKDLVPTLTDEIAGAKQELGHILQAGLSHASLRLRTASLLLVCEIVCYTEKQAWAPLLQTGGVLVQVLQQLVQAHEEDMLKESIQAFTEVNSWEPDFFKVQLAQSMEPAKFMATVARSREGVENGVRSLALEWLVSYLEKRVKWLTKHLEQYAPVVLEACMEFLLEVDDGEQELKAWVARVHDEEGDEDEDELFHTGEEAVDRVAQAVQMETLSQPLFHLIGRYAAQDKWQAKHAALAAVKQTVEYVEEKSHIDQIASLLLRHVDNPHPRVRYTALHAIGQLANDQAPSFQEAWHQTVMPMLLKMMDDPIDRVAAMAMSAFVSFGEELDSSLMLGYSQGFMEKLVAKLQATQHRGVREESITCLAVIAGNILKEFARYYDAIMPMLKHFVIHATGEKENRLRGKSFECMSLLGIAVGKEKFLPDAREAITEMLKTPLDADDVQREYIKEASERICQCLKRDFAPFLPALLPGLFRSLKFEEVAERGTREAADEDEDAYVEVSTGDGRLVPVHSTKFEEMKQSIQLLCTFCVEMEGAYFEWVPATAEVLLPLLSNSDAQFAMYCEEVRGRCLQAWGLLIKVARAGSDERSLGHELTQTLLSTGLKTTFATLEKKSSSAETLAATASGITECIKNARSGIIQTAEVLQIVERMFSLIDESMGRSKQTESTKKEKKTAQAAVLPKELGDEEEEDQDWEEGEEEQLRRNCEEVLGSVMEVAKEHFLPCVPRCAERIGAWVLGRRHRVLGLYLACDLLLHLREHSEPAWPVFMPEVFRSLGDEDADARTAAAYAINMAAPLPSFAQASPEAFRSLARIVEGTKPKKRDFKGKRAFDNAVAALFSLAREKPGLCPPEVQPWPLVLSKLPLREDVEEGQKVHEKLVDLVLAQDQGLLGGPSRGNLGPVLSVLAEVYSVDSICNKDTEEKVLKVFRLLPRDILQGLASGFTEKQQKKIEKMLSG